MDNSNMQVLSKTGDEVGFEFTTFCLLGSTNCVIYTMRVFALARMSMCQYTE